MDECYERLKRESLQVVEDEPEMERLLRQTTLAPVVSSFEDAVAQIMCQRLLLPARGGIDVISPSFYNTSSNISENDEERVTSECPISPKGLRKLIHMCMKSEVKEAGWTMSEAIRKDAMAVVERDPAMDTILEVVLFAKGYMALCCHRVAFRLWHMKRKFGALFMQSQASAMFGTDIHPLARIGQGVMMDHATGIVVGETGKYDERSSCFFRVDTVFD